MWWRNPGEKLWDPLTITGTLHHAEAPGAHTAALLIGAVAALATGILILGTKHTKRTRPSRSDSR